MYIYIYTYIYTYIHIYIHKYIYVYKYIYIYINISQIKYECADMHQVDTLPMDRIQIMNVNHKPESCRIRRSKYALSLIYMSHATFK